MATVPLCDPWFNYPLLRAKRPLLSSYFSLPRGRKHIIGAIKSDGDHSSTSQNCLPPLQPCNQTMAPALAPGNGHPPETCTPCPGIPDRVPCCFFVAARRVRQQVCTPRGRAGIPTWAGLIRNLASLSRCLINLSRRESHPGFISLQNQCFMKEADILQKTEGERRKRCYWEEKSEEGKHQHLDFKEKHSTSFSRVLFAYSRSSLF